MSLPTFETSRASDSRIAGVPAWLFYSLLANVAWAAWSVVSKVVSNEMDASSNQVFFTLGLLPLIVMVLCSPRVRDRSLQRRTGQACAFLTGILGGAGNIAFFHALALGGKASIVISVTALFPLVTVILAVSLLHERVSPQQKLGLILALAAIYLLSM
jgi:transporter family protein